MKQALTDAGMQHMTIEQQHNIFARQIYLLVLFLRLLLCLFILRYKHKYLVTLHYPVV